MLAEKPFCVCQGCVALLCLPRLCEAERPHSAKVRQAEMESKCAPANQQLTLAKDPCFALHPQNPASILITACSCRANTALHVSAEPHRAEFLWLLLDWRERPQPRLGPR